MLDNDDPIVPNVDEHATLEASGMRAWPLARLLDKYEAARAESMQWLGALTPDQLARSGRHASAGAIRIADVMHHVAYHDLLHLGQITQKLYAPVEPRRGAMGAAFPPV